MFPVVEDSSRVGCNLQPLLRQEFGDILHEPSGKQLLFRRPGRPLFLEQTLEPQLRFSVLRTSFREDHQRRLSSHSGGVTRRSQGS